MSAPDKKRPRLDGPEDVAENIDDGETEREEKMNVVLALCGSFNPITFLHLRLFGESILCHCQKPPKIYYVSLYEYILLYLTAWKPVIIILILYYRASS